VIRAVAIIEGPPAAIQVVYRAVIVIEVATPMIRGTPEHERV
jgi:hypothetical protein